MFNGWWDNLDRLSEGKTRMIMQQELYKRILYRRALTGLRTFADEKLHEKRIIGIFQTKQSMIKKAQVLSVFLTKNYEEKVDLKQFMQMMLPYGQEKLRLALKLWQRNADIDKREEIADNHFRARQGEVFMKRAFEQLRLNTANGQVKTMKQDWLNKVYCSQLLRSSFNNLALYSKKKVKSKHAWLIASDRAEKWLKSKVFRALFINKEQGVNSNLSAIENSIVHAFNKIRMRKVVIALQNFSAMSVKARIVSAKWDLRTKDKFMAVWQEQAFRKQKMNRMFSILQQ